MHVHILGICGKFMSGLAIIAKQKGYTVSGSDENLLPLIADSLCAMGIQLTQGYEVSQLTKKSDCIIIGNALSRGKPIIEHLLNENIPYFSGPEWLLKHVLQDKWVLAISGTHGKTTTTSMLAWILQEAGYNPGFLIGGNPSNFELSARYTDSNFFVIEADEYDTAFFDKRSKFLHYNPRTLIINNIEFDHADIFADLDAIKKQFVHLLRIVPGNGLIIAKKHDENVQSVFTKGCWTPVDTFDARDANWTYNKINKDGSEVEVFHQTKSQGKFNWNILGDHNIENALAAIAAARHVGIAPSIAMNSLSTFKGVKRRLELKGIVKGIHVYDDFAHHPTAISTTITALRNYVKEKRIFAVLEFGSNTMRTGFHKQTIVTAFNSADSVILLRPKSSDWNVDEILREFKQPVKLFDNVQEIVGYLAKHCQSGDHILCMSNMMFDGIHEKLLHQISNTI